MSEIVPVDPGLPPDVLPPGWRELPEVLRLANGPTLEEIRALVDRGSPGDPLVRNAYVGVMLEALPFLRRVVLGEVEASVKERIAAGKLMQQIALSLGIGPGGRGSAAVPTTGGLNRGGRRLSFSVVVESAPETSVREMLDGVAKVIAETPAP